MKSEIRQNSIELRKKGFSIKEISQVLSVSKSSVSTWVRDVVLTDRQKVSLMNKNNSIEIIEKRRRTRLKNEADKKRVLINAASTEIRSIDQNMLKMIGIALYWGEGGKTMKGMARISNSDPELVRISMRFFREVCEVKEDRFRAHIHIHSIKMVKEAQKYWSIVTGIPESQFYKTYVIKRKKLKNIRDTLKFGTIDVGVCDTKLLLKILGWIEGIKKQL